ncbi:MAG TPA: M57 family metalloprotease [Chitinophagaceae bacterium]|nr:M57 family metalloprotease [Chitinophagaceae bacterium]
MRQMLKPLAFLLIAGFAITSCKKEVKDPAQGQISPETLTKINDHGFGTSDVQKVEEGYLVEGDIILTEDYLNSTPGGNYLRIANNEQYRTTLLVTGLPRNITISSSGNISAGLSSAIDAAIARYNAQNLRITMSRVASGGDIVIRLVNGANYIASSGFPTNSGAPYSTVKYNKAYQNYSSGFMTTVIAHEVGHCIGFRHTDYMDRSYSCGGSPTNEGASGVGAVLIPGTPSGPDSGSWMLACLSATTNRPFNNNDKTALNYLY